jgi:hypothetical protein
VDLDIDYDDDKFIQHILYNIRTQQYQPSMLMHKEDISSEAQTKVSGSRRDDPVTLPNIKDDLQQNQVNSKELNSQSPTSKKTSSLHNTVVGNGNTYKS